MKHYFRYESDPVRLDQYLPKAIPGLSRTQASVLIDDGSVTVNGKSVKPSFKLIPGSEVFVNIPDPVVSDILPEDIPLRILYEDDDLLVVDKPQGMVVHPAPGHYSGTLVNALMYYCRDSLSDINGTIRPGIIHRIDKDTSGLLIVVKNNRIHSKMAKMISDHDIVRKYRCCVHGFVESEKGTIDAPIGRSAGDRKKMAVKGSGKHAITHFEVLTRFAKASDLSVVLETGRTHQIRAHMSFIGHPAIGDPLYAGRRPKYGLVGQALHSKTLEFIHPDTGKQITVDSELPEYYSSLLERLSKED
ncbi:MAG: RluA family pseudouridine synthase [Clostridiaceae bacterium]|jgi:23S rRNA pseudouridine1911/1915/1917 synthase|nr:RluA family pseudouridine synthase [Clostridiaceae bacterium]